MEKNILDNIFGIIGCAYLSDLKLIEEHPEWYRKINEIELKTYSLQEWGLAFAYMIGKKQVFSSYEELEEWLSARE